MKKIFFKFYTFISLLLILNSSLIIHNCEAQQVQTYNKNYNCIIRKNSINSDKSVLAVTSKQLDGNNISTWFVNNGSCNRDTINNAGFIWPKGTTRTARYASGIWLGANIGYDTLVSIAEYTYDYQPGYIIAGTYQGVNDTNYRVYKIERGVYGYDYYNWPYNQERIQIRQDSRH